MAAGITWEGDLKKVLARAQGMQEPVFVDFFNPG